MNTIDKNKILDEIIEDNWNLSTINQSDQGRGVICGFDTSFISRNTKRHVCCDECLYNENGWD